MKVCPIDHVWINGDLNTILYGWKRLYWNYIRHGVKSDNFRHKCNKAALDAQKNYLNELGNDLANPNTGRESILTNYKQSISFAEWGLEW